MKHIKKLKKNGFLRKIKREARKESDLSLITITPFRFCYIDKSCLFSNEITVDFKNPTLAH